MVYQGPTRPSTNVKKFRKTGVSEKASYQGPTRPETDVKKFRKTGVSEKASYQGPTRPGTDVKKFRSTGSSVSSSVRSSGISEQQRIIAAQQEASRLADLEIEKRRQLQQAQQVQQEQVRIQKLAVKLRAEGARERTKIRTDKDSRDKIEQTTLINRGGERIFTSRNLTTGKTTTKTFQKAPKGKMFEGGGRVAQTGGIIGLSSLDTGKLDTGKLNGSGGTITLENRQVDTFKGVPIFKLVATDKGVERKATKEEQEFFKKQTNVLVAKEGKPSKIVRLFTGGITKFSQAEKRFAERSTSNLDRIYKDKTGKSIGEVFASTAVQSPLAISGVSGKIIERPKNVYTEKSLEFIGGAIEGVTQDIIDKPLTNAAIFASGSIARGALVTGGRIAKVATSAKSIKVVSKGLSAISKSSLTSVGLKSGVAPKLGKPLRKIFQSVKSIKAPPVYIGTKGFTAPKIGLGKTITTGITGLYATTAATRIVSQPTFELAGGEAGRLTKDLFLFTSGAKFGADATKIITTKTPTRLPKKVTATEVAGYVDVNGKRIRVAEFKITGEVKPPIRTIKTTKLREEYFFDPIVNKISPARAFKVETVKPVIGSKPFEVETIIGKTGRSKFSMVSGITKPLNVKLKGTKLEEFLKVRLAEVKVKRPVKIGDAANLLGGKDKTFKSIIDVKELRTVKVRGRKINIGIKDTLKSERFASSSRVKTIGENDFVKISESDIIFKPKVKGKRAIAAGKTPELKSTIIEFKEPFVTIDSGSTTKILRPSGGKRTSFSKTFSVDSQELSQAIETKTIPIKISPPTTTKNALITSKITTPTLEGIPRSVGGAGLTQEQISRGQGNVFGGEEIIFTPTMRRDSVRLKDFTSTSNIQTLTPIASTKTLLDLGLKSKVKQKSKLKTLTKVGTLQSLKSVSQLKELQKTKQIQKTKQMQKTKQIQKLGFKQIGLIPPQPTKIFTQKEPPIKPPKFIPPKFKTSKEDNSSKGLFTVSVRRKGKFRKIGKGLSLKDALNVGTQKTSRTLAATFKVTGTGGTTLKGALRTPKGFRRKGGLFIEQNKLRLNRLGEVTEIKRAKKTRRK